MKGDPIGDLLVALGKGLLKLTKLTGQFILYVYRKTFKKSHVSEAMKRKLDDGFQSIGFKDKLGKTPQCTYYFYDKEKRMHVYIFKSMSPYTNWQNQKEPLSVTLNKKIYDIAPYQDQQHVKIIGVDNTVRFPSLIDWRWLYLIDDDTTFVIGVNLIGSQVKFDLRKTPHALLVGTTGSGKSVALQLIVAQALYKGWKLAFIDFKKVEFTRDYEAFGSVAHTMDQAISILKEINKENLMRQNLFERENVKNIKEYNDKFPDQRLSYVGIVIDELAEVMDGKSASSKAEKEMMQEAGGVLSSIARTGRAQGVNILTAIQRPEAALLGGQLRDMLNVRLCGYFVNAEGYRMVLGSEGSLVRADDYFNYNEVNMNDVDKKNSASGRFAITAGTSAEMMQAYNYKTEWLEPDKVKQKGRCLVIKHTVFKPPIPEEKRADSPKSITVPVDASRKNDQLADTETLFTFKYDEMEDEI